MIRKRYRVLLAVVIIVGFSLALGLAILAQRRPDLLGLEKPARVDALKLMTVGDIPLRGGTSRFDYQSINLDDGRLYIAHLGPAWLRCSICVPRRSSRTFQTFPSLTAS